MEPKNWWFGSMFLLFQGCIFKCKMLVFERVILVCKISRNFILPHPLGLPDHHQAHNGLRQVAMQWKGSPSTRIAKWMKWIDDLGDINGCATSPTSPTWRAPKMMGLAKGEETASNMAMFGSPILNFWGYTRIGIPTSCTFHLPPENIEANLRQRENSGRVLDVPFGS